MKVFHASTATAAAGIAANGFRDTPGSRFRRNGVFVADVPLTEADIAGPHRNAWFEIEVPSAALEGFEYALMENDWRVWLVPAEMLNRYPRRERGDDVLDEVRSTGLVTDDWEEVQEDSD